jgi:hypothetical protein
VQPYPDQPAFIEVSAYVDSLVTPNQIFIRIVLNEKDQATFDQLETKMVKSINGLGINADKYLQGSDMLSNYRSHVFKKRDILKSKEYLLEVGSGAIASKVFIELENLGIFNAVIERIGHTGLAFIHDVCRTQAIAIAKNKAVALTKPIGQQVGKALSIVDRDVNSVQLEQGTIDGDLKGVSALGYESKASFQNVQFDKIRLRTFIKVNFELL